MNLYAEVALLVLDEIGRQFDTETEKNYMFELINERYNRHKQTMLVSNLDTAEFKALVGTAITDRLKEGGGKVVVFNWPSLRY
jgi:DNA replication protein DnaC